jgi:CrcB protein
VTVVLLALAGALGAVSRFVVDGVARERWGGAPYGTLVVNVSGSLLLGVVTGLVLFQGAPDTLRTLVGVGFCGGYTTFSTASIETVRLVQERRPGTALLYATGTLGLTVLAGAAGLLLTQV